MKLTRGTPMGRLSDGVSSVPGVRGLYQRPTPWRAALPMRTDRRKQLVEPVFGIIQLEARRFRPWSLFIHLRTLGDMSRTTTSWGRAVICL